MNSRIKSIHLAIEALAGSLDCGRDAAEEVLNELEIELKSLTPSERADFRRRMIFIVAQLSRLEVRLMGDDRF
jgi:hypothetical protein